MKKQILLNAIIWAAVILIASYLFKGHENYKTLFGVLIVAAGFQNALLYNAFKKGKQL
jgi:hypothetical protein